MAAAPFRTGRILKRSLVYHARSHLGAALGAAVACAVLTGALLVGDSVRGSLRALTLGRLGRVEHVLLGERPFGAGLSAALKARPRVQTLFEPPVAALFLRGSASAPRPDGSGPRLGGVSVIALEAGGLEILTPPGQAAPPFPLGRKALVNRRLAEDLGLGPGDPLVCSLESAARVPRESFAGRRDDPARSLRLEVLEVIPDRGPGLFSLASDQRVPRNVIVDLAEVSRALDLTGRAGALLVAAREAAGEEARGRAGARVLLEELREAARAEDLGLRLELRGERGFLQVESEAFQIEPALERPVKEAAEALRAPAASILTYLANTIRLSRPGEAPREIPYSTVTALDGAAPPPLGPLKLRGGEAAPPLERGEILLGGWAARDLRAREGDPVEIEYFRVEPGGELTTSRAEFRVRGILAEGGISADPGLTPEFPGVTDAARIGDWDPPFPLDLKRIRARDEEYWKDYRATPKAFVALMEGRRLWANRFGEATAVRVGPAPGRTLAETEVLLREELARRLDPAQIGLTFRPVREEALAAASGATDFSVLYLAFSFFLIAAAALLTGLLWGIGLHRRAREWGILRAVGFGGGAVLWLGLIEGLCVSGAGALAGLFLAPLHAGALLSGLFEGWSPSVRPPRLELHATPLSFAVGYLSSLLCVAAATAISCRSIARSSPRALLGGGWGREAASADAGGRPARARSLERPFSLGGRAAPALAAFLVLAAAGLTLPALLSSSYAARARAAAFFGAGAALLGAGTTLLWWFFSSRERRGVSPRRGRRGRVPGLLWLGIVNARSHPGRSTLTAALMASAAFVVVAAGAARRDEDPAEGAPGDRRISGTGGFELVLTTEVPVFRRLDDPEGREALGVPGSIDGVPLEWESAEVVSLRVREGEDASCLNLYRAGRPRILGAPPELVRRGGFRFHSSEARTPEEVANPWLLIARPRPGDASGAVPARPAIADEATATWVLHAGLGEEIPIVDGRGAPARLRLVALLEGSVLQGSLIVSEEDLLSLFPATAGYRFFLLGGPRGEVERMRRALVEALGPHGLDAVPARRLLLEYRRVEEAYLETFRVLGGLGLLLGAAGLGAVLLRGTMERRGELAALRALGYRPSALTAMVLGENVLLVASGLGLGAASALVAALPHLARDAGSVPWGGLALTLAGAAAVGLAGGLLAIRAALRTPLLPALRAE